MDRYKASDFLYRVADRSRLKIFDTFDVEIPYYLATHDRELIRELLNDNSCFKKRITKQEVDSLLIRYLKPTKVITVNSLKADTTVRRTPL